MGVQLTAHSPCGPEARVNLPFLTASGAHEVADWFLIKMDSTHASAVPKAKAKRQNRKAKFERVRSDLLKERKQRVAVEKAANTWKERALTRSKLIAYKQWIFFYSCY